MVSSLVRDPVSPILNPAEIETAHFSQKPCSTAISPHPLKDVERPTPMLSLPCAKDAVKQRRPAPSMQISFVTRSLFLQSYGVRF